MAASGPVIHDLIDAHYQGLYRYAYRLTGSAADAEDLTQETFGKAMARLSQLREKDKAKGWLFRILRNAYLHRVRDDKRSKVIPLDGFADVAQPEPEPRSWEIDSERLQHALCELDESFRTPLILFYFEEFSYKDIADQLDLPIGTVMSRLARAKAYLKAKLSEEGGRTNDVY
ncbi:MAG TPA: sigma-70 family RNA polymerase sigma factor [Fimbriiglobus sp.]|jgi:RNA polymerase sigma-70 factor (ECF subfamily)